MVIDRVENNEYVIQNTSPTEDHRMELRIPLDKAYYIKDWNEYISAGGNKVTDYNMDVGEFYLGQTAFSVQIKLPWFNKAEFFYVLFHDF